MSAKEKQKKHHAPEGGGGVSQTPHVAQPLLLSWRWLIFPSCPNISPCLSICRHFTRCDRWPVQQTV